MLATAKSLRATKVEFFRLETGYSYDPGAVENARETIKNLFNEIPTLNVFDCIQTVSHAEGLRFKRDELDQPKWIQACGRSLMEPDLWWIHLQREET